MELAQLICDRTSKLSEADEPHDVAAAALKLARASHHDPTMLAHAAALFRTRLRDDPGDSEAADSLRLLSEVLAFLR